MKKFISLLSVLCITVAAFVSCDVSNGAVDIDIDTDSAQNTNNSELNGESEIAKNTENKTEKVTEKQTEAPLKATEGLSLEPLGDGNYQLSGMKRECKEHDIVIPSEFKGGKVVKIRDKAFYNCFEILSAVIPDSVTTIGEFAFLVQIFLK